MMDIRHLPNRVTIREFPLKLDLGCGQYKLNGYHGMDWADYGQEIKWDATQGIPLPDSSVCDLYTSHFLEHLNWEQFYFVMAEILRVCQNGAKLTIRVPHGDTIEGHLTCHYIRITEDTLKGIERNWTPWEQWSQSEKHSNFEITSIRREEYHLIGEFIVRK